MKRQVVLTPEAQDDPRRIDDWWRANRPAATGLFTEELSAALAMLEATPEIERPYRHRVVWSAAQGRRKVTLARLECCSAGCPEGDHGDGHCGPATPRPHETVHRSHDSRREIALTAPGTHSRGDLLEDEMLAPSMPIDGEEALVGGQSRLAVLTRVHILLPHVSSPVGRL